MFGLLLILVNHNSHKCYQNIGIGENLSTIWYYQYFDMIVNQKALNLCDSFQNILMF